MNLFLVYNEHSIISDKTLDTFAFDAMIYDSGKFV